MTHSVACCLTILIVPPLALLAADPPKKVPVELAQAEATFERDVAKARAGCEMEVQAITKRYVVQLDKIQKELAAKGNLDGAVLAKEAKEAAAAAAAPKTPAGTYRVRYHPNGSERTYQVKPTGDVAFVSDANTPPGKLRPGPGGTFLLQFENNKLERITFAGQRMIVEHFNPASNYADNKPDQIGIGEILRDR